MPKRLLRPQPMIRRTDPVFLLNEKSPAGLRAAGFFVIWRKRSLQARFRVRDFNPAHDFAAADRKPMFVCIAKRLDINIAITIKKPRRGSARRGVRASKENQTNLLFLIDSANPHDRINEKGNTKCEQTALSHGHKLDRRNQVPAAGGIVHVNN